MKTRRNYAQYRPDLSKRFAPRVSIRLRKAINRVCRRNDMPEADVLGYALQAATLLVHARKLSLKAPGRQEPMVAIVMLRTSWEMFDRINQIHARQQRRPGEKEMPYHVVLRQLLETIIPIAEKRGMAHVMALREKLLTPRG